MVRRVRLSFVRGVEVEFTNREVAIKQFEEIANRGTRFPLVIFGPEGCGKTALLKQAIKLLEDYDYNVVYVNPNEREFEKAIYSTGNIRELLTDTFKELLSIHFGNIVKTIADLGLVVASKIIKKFTKPKIAVLMDDIFQAIGLERTTITSYVKSALNLIEYPPAEYESIVVIIVTSEGLSRREIGRHRWAELTPIWNMPKNGFRKLYEKVLHEGVLFKEVWEWTGGNPWLLARLYEMNWNISELLKRLLAEKRLLTFVLSLNQVEREGLKEALNNPDKLLRREYIPLIDKLVELNLIVDTLYDRNQKLWIDTPPPEKDLKLGIGRHIAWQTPLHREAVRKALKIE